MQINFFREYKMSLVINNNKIKGYIDGQLILECEDNHDILDKGGAGFVVSDGTMVSNEIKIS